MNDKGFIGVGTFIALFIGIIVAMILILPSANNVALSTDAQAIANVTFTAPAAGSSIDLVGQELLDTPIVTNASTAGGNGVVVPASNYTIEEAVSSVDGLKRIRYTSNAGWQAGKAVNISYSYGAEGYMDDAGSRAIFDLVVVFGALAVGLIVLSKVLDDGGDILGG